MRYILDTNVFIDAFADPAENEALQRFHAAFAPDELLSAVVAHELAVGVRSAADARRLERAVLAPFRRRQRVIVPSADSWDRAAAALARLATLDGISRGSFTRAFADDVLIAASCRQAGATVLTRNLRDFARIRRVLAFRFAAPWPVPRPR